MAVSPTGQTRAQMPHSTSLNAMQRLGSSSRVANRYPSHNWSGTVSASVGQTLAHGISGQTVHGWIAGSIIGVPVASPALGGASIRARTGHTSKQSPQRVHAAMKATSSNAPGGRKKRCGTMRRSVRLVTSSTKRPRVERKKFRRSPSPLTRKSFPPSRAICSIPAEGRVVKLDRVARAVEGIPLIFSPA